MSVQEAIRSGLVGDDTPLRLDRSSGSVALVDQSQAELVDAFAASKSVADWLDEVELRLSTDNGTRLDDPDSVQREIASLQVYT